MKTTNKVEINGFVGMVPEVKTLKNGSKMARFSIATDEVYKNNAGEWIKNTTWHPVVVWNKIAEKAGSMLNKGSKVAILGKLRSRSYTDNTGIVRNITEIIAFQLEPDFAA